METAEVGAKGEGSRCRAIEKLLATELKVVLEKPA
jgi:hypothetical protein